MTIGIHLLRIYYNTVWNIDWKSRSESMVEDTLFSGESKNIEYKVTLPDKSEKYMKTIVAFANTQGGKLIVGVDDKTHQIVGVENSLLYFLQSPL